jgi:hypothetical protein
LGKLKIALFIMSGLFLFLFVYLALISPFNLDYLYMANEKSAINQDGYGGSFSNTGNYSLLKSVATSIGGGALSFEPDSKSGGGGVR